MFTSEQPYLVVLYQAMLATAYFGLLRIGEITLSLHVLKAKDVHMGSNKNKLLFILHSSKTHTKGCKPQQIKIDEVRSKPRSTASRCKILCPFKLLKTYLTLRLPYVSDQEAFFVFKDRSPVKPYQFRRILRQAILFNNLNPSYYSAQGLRSGRATDLLDMGVSVETIRKLGRWQSTAIYTYLRF